MEKHLPILETERLIIRPIQMDDAAYFFAMDSQPEVHTFLNNEPVQSIEEMKKAIAHIQQQYEKYGIGRLGVIEKSSRRGSRSSTGRVEHQYARKSTGKL
jgi:RimJ/RimL family protein N-acetyltransferase